MSRATTDSTVSQCFKFVGATFCFRSLHNQYAVAHVAGTYPARAMLPTAVYGWSRSDAAVRSRALASYWQRACYFKWNTEDSW